MEQAKLESELREGRGKGAARTARRAGLIPAIIYGHKLAPMAIQLPERNLHRFMVSSGENILINMGIGKDESETVMLKEIQIDPVSRQIVHADFIRVSLEERVATHVPIILIGSAPGIAEGGIQEFLLRELEVECQVGLIPENIEIDISSLEIGKQVRVGDITLEENMAILDDPSTIIVAVALPSIKEEEEEEEEEEGEEVEIEEEEMEPEVIGKKRTEEEEEAEE